MLKRHPDNRGLVGADRQPGDRMADVLVWAMALALVLYSLNSYPMMQPGLDIWWHLAMTEAPDKVDPNVFSAVRLSWHHLWHRILLQGGWVDVFDRALVIHRVQTLITLSLVAFSAYLALRAITHQWVTEKRLIALAALLGAFTWPLANGTASTPHGGNPEQPLIQSWINWYSVNYQISLPLYLGATSALLFALSGASDNRSRWISTALSLLLIATGTLIHAAETAYFLVALVFLGLIYLRGSKAWWIALALGLLSAATLSAALKFSYVTPELITGIGQGDWAMLLKQISERGNAMTSQGLNRAETGWHILNTMGLVALLLSGFLMQVKKPVFHLKSVDHRPLIFLILTTLMPISLLFDYSSGLLAMMTNQYIAWRFAFASFLFLGIPLLALVIGRLIPDNRAPYRAGFMFLMTAIACASAIAYSYLAETRQPVFRFGHSLLQSLDKTPSHFGLDASQRAALAKLAVSQRAKGSGTPLCTDIPTAYHLFFVQRYPAVSLPDALSHLPGYQRSPTVCDFPAPLFNPKHTD